MNQSKAFHTLVSQLRKAQLSLHKRMKEAEPNGPQSANNNRLRLLDDLIREQLPNESTDSTARTTR